MLHCLRVALSAAPPSGRPPWWRGAEAAIQKALKYLVSRQSADGSFRDQGQMGTPTPSRDVACRAGPGQFGQHADRGQVFAAASQGLNYVLRRRSVTASSAARRRGVPLDVRHGSHVVLAEVMGTETDPQSLEQIRCPSCSGVYDLTAKSQSRLGGWLYTPEHERRRGSGHRHAGAGVAIHPQWGVAVPKRVIDRAMST